MNLPYILTLTREGNACSKLWPFKPCSFFYFHCLNSCQLFVLLLWLTTNDSIYLSWWIWQSPYQQCRMQFHLTSFELTEHSLCIGRIYSIVNASLDLSQLSAFWSLIWRRFVPIASLKTKSVEELYIHHHSEDWYFLLWCLPCGQLASCNSQPDVNATESYLE